LRRYQIPIDTLGIRNSADFDWRAPVTDRAAQRLASL
jgi:hypothetical protein